MLPIRQILQGLKPMVRPVRGRIALSVLIGLVRIAASLGFVWICKRLVDIATGDLAAPLGPNIGIMLGIMLLQLACIVATSAWESYNTARTGNELRADAFARVLRSTWTGRETYRSGDAVNRLEEDVRVVNDLLCSRMPEVLITLIQLIAASTYLMLMAPNLLWVLLVLMVAAVVGSRLFFRKMRQLTEELFRYSLILSADGGSAPETVCVNALLEECIAGKMAAWCEKLGREVPSVAVRKMKTKWASCIRSKGKIAFNAALARVPPRCIEYVIVHELTHFEVANHSKAFVRLMNGRLPHWRALREELNGFVGMPMEVKP